VIHKEARVMVELIVSIPKDVDDLGLLTIDIPYDYIKVSIKGRPNHSHDSCVVEYDTAERDYLTRECGGCSNKIELAKERSNEYGDLFCKDCWEKNRPHESEG
jgi:hypothetical protein